MSNLKPTSFSFSEVRRTLHYATDKTLQQSRMKWGLNSARIVLLRYREYWDPESSEQTDLFMKCLFNDTSFHTQLGTAFTGAVDEVQYETVPCTMTDLSVLRAFEESGHVRQNGNMAPCVPDVANGVSFADRVRGGFAQDQDEVEDFDESWPEVIADNADQFLVRLFRHVVLGGSICQYDDAFEPYLQACKLLYKDLVAVRRVKNTKAIEVVSRVFSVDDVDLSDKVPSNDSTGSSEQGGTDEDNGESKETLEETKLTIREEEDRKAGNSESTSTKQVEKKLPQRDRLFVKDHVFNVCWVSVDPYSRLVTVYFFAFNR